MRELRSQLGMTQAEFARHLGVHKNSVSSWERRPESISPLARMKLYNVARWRALTQTHTSDGLRHSYDDDLMRYYEGKPGPEWRTWSGHKRGSFLAHRARYSRIKKDIQAGRAMGQPVVRLLDDAPDLDTVK